ncbi:DUF3833 family protein [Sphingobium sp. BS19]|uniref:DUF3833 family protein n=1 Tax=Sphingobium sp. BS19 TaxID=3018973 RepID=UPI002491AE35|nr:DUF3833 family protein [Sphingobium sp. BS19]
MLANPCRYNVVRTRAGALFALGLLCVSTSIGAAPPARKFDPAAFFAGRTVGDARLKVMMSRAKAIHVDSTGRVEADGALAVSQVVAEEGKPVKQRSWRIRMVAPGRYEGTLSDASGPVKGVMTDNVLNLRFAMKGGLQAEQKLTLRPDGLSVHNAMTIRKFGMTVATLEETIRKLD